MYHLTSAGPALADPITFVGTWDGVSASLSNRTSLEPDGFPAVCAFSSLTSGSPGEEQSYVSDAGKVYIAGCSKKRSPDYLEIIDRIKAEIEDSLLETRAAVKMRIAELAEPSEDED